MTLSIVPVTGYILALIVAALAVYFWRRSAGLYSLLVEGAGRFEELRQRNNTLEQGLAKAEEKFKQHREATQRLEKAVDEARTKASELMRQLEIKEQEIRYVTEKLELQKGHLEKQLLRSQELLRTQESRLGEAEARENSLKQNMEKAHAADRTAWEIREKELKLRLGEVETQLQAHARKPDADPEELRKMRRKVAQYDRLYNTMKGLREMTEERNRNWEVALRKMSVHILQHDGLQRALPDNIGAVVGLALKTIGAQLIEDQELHAEHHGAAERAGSMEDDLEADHEHAEGAGAEHSASFDDLPGKGRQAPGGGPSLT